jgi:hypothetical protein
MGKSVSATTDDDGAAHFDLPRERAATLRRAVLLVGGVRVRDIEIAAPTSLDAGEP